MHLMARQQLAISALRKEALVPVMKRLLLSGALPSFHEDRLLVVPSVEAHHILGRPAPALLQLSDEGPFLGLRGCLESLVVAKQGVEVALVFRAGAHAGIRRAARVH